MKYSPIIENNDAESASDKNLSQSSSEKSGVVKKILDWVAKGAEKTKTCPT